MPSEFDEETKSLVREGVPLELNAFDAYAVAQAVRLREQHGGEVVAMTMGPPQAEEALRVTLALGADRCIHLSDRVFALADTLGTSRTLALAIRKEGADLVLCGRKAVDSETWQVPPEVAAFLGLPHVTNVASLELDGSTLQARRLGAEGEELYELELPALCSIALLRRSRRRGRARRRRRRQDQRLDCRGPRSGRAAQRQALRPNGLSDAGARGARRLARADAGALRGSRRSGPPPKELLAERPAQGTSWEKPERLGENPGNSYDCWCVVELVEGRVARVSLELLGKSRGARRQARRERGGADPRA